MPDPILECWGPFLALAHTSCPFTPWQAQALATVTNAAMSMGVLSITSLTTGLLARCGNKKCACWLGLRNEVEMVSLC